MKLLQKSKLLAVLADNQANWRFPSDFFKILNH